MHAIEERLKISLSFVAITNGNDDMLCEQPQCHRIESCSEFPPLRSWTSGALTVLPVGFDLLCGYAFALSVEPGLSQARAHDRLKEKSTWIIRLNLLLTIACRHDLYPYLRILPDRACYGAGAGIKSKYFLEGCPGRTLPNRIGRPPGPSRQLRDLHRAVVVVDPSNHGK